MKKETNKDLGGPILMRTSSVADYIRIVQDLASTTDGPIWLRGHSSAAYRLLPSALRDTIPLTSPLGYPLHGKEIQTASGGIETGLSPERMLDDFKRRALPFIDFHPRNDFEWMFLMQHHGAPTRLLDWTSNALVALYFAVSDAKDIPRLESSGDRELGELDPSAAAIFVMNPRQINEEFHVHIAAPVDIAANYDYWQPYSRPMSIHTEDFDTYGPICIEAPQISPRIRAQSGLFTLHGSNLYPIDYYTVTRPLLTKILISAKDAIQMRSQLYNLGITSSFIFPGLDGVAKEVRENEARTFAWERKRYLAELDVSAPETPRRKKHP